LILCLGVVVRDPPSPASNPAADRRIIDGRFRNANGGE
jgi:hypothetical protein